MSLFFGPGEQMVLAAQGNGPDCSLHGVGVEFDPAVIEESGEPALDELAKVYARFTDGFDTLELRTARRLLQENSKTLCLFRPKYSLLCRQKFPVLDPRRPGLKWRKAGTYGLLRPSGPNCIAEFPVKFPVSGDFPAEKGSTATASTANHPNGRFSASGNEQFLPTFPALVVMRRQSACLFLGPFPWSRAFSAFSLRASFWGMSSNPGNRDDRYASITATKLSRQSPRSLYPVISFPQ